MIKLMKKRSLQMGAAFTAGVMLSSSQAHAANDFSSIAGNITNSISSIPVS